MRGFGCALMVLWLAGCTFGDSEDVAVEPENTMAIGEDIYNKFCFQCHAAGLAGAPMVGDTEAWSVRAAKGNERLLISTVEGMPPGMPPMGMCMACTDVELNAAIEFMVAPGK